MRKVGTYASESRKQGATREFLTSDRKEEGEQVYPYPPQAFQPPKFLKGQNILFWSKRQVWVGG